MWSRRCVYVVGEPTTCPHTMSISARVFFVNPAGLALPTACAKAIAVAQAATRRRCRQGMANLEGEEPNLADKVSEGRILLRIFPGTSQLP